MEYDEKNYQVNDQFDLGHTNLFCIPEVTSLYFSSGDSVVGNSIDFNQAN